MTRVESVFVQVTARRSFKAAVTGHNKDWSKKLVSEGADLTSTNGAPLNPRPLHQSAHHNRPENVRTLIQLCREKRVIDRVLEG